MPKIWLGAFLLWALLPASSLSAQGTCGNLQLQLTPDYSFAIGSSSGGSGYTFTLGGKTLAEGSMTQLALFHYDGSLASTSEIMPSESVGTSFVPGKFGSAVTVAAGGTLSYPAAGNLGFGDGTVEMWVSPQYAGGNALYAAANQVLFQYWGSDGNQLVLGTTNNGSTGPYIYVGAEGVYGGYPQVSGIAAWNAGDWHHLAFTYSSSQGRVRIYVDGVLAVENDAAIQFPGGGPSTFTIGSDGAGNASNFAIDEVRISNDEMPASAIAYDAKRSTPFANDEILLPLAGVSPGQLTYSVAGCGTAMYSFAGVPITNLNPPSTLLAPGSTSVALSFNTMDPTSCRYSVGSAMAYSSMQPIDVGGSATMHGTTVSGLSPDVNVLNSVYIRCLSYPDYLLTLTYRDVAAPAGAFPRVGSLFRGYLYAADPNLGPKVQLYEGGFTAANTIRSKNPDVIIMPAISAISSSGDESVPDNYYLKDVNGNPIAFEPGSFYLNLTNPQVGEFLAQYAYQLLVEYNFAFDGVFFDNFTTSISYVTTDVYGNPVQIDSNGDGQPDNPATLDAAWKSGIDHMMETFKSLVPYAYTAGHLPPGPPDAESLATFNGDSINFQVTDVREGTSTFSELWTTYQDWFANGNPNIITMVQSAPPSQLAYGYGLTPLQAMLPETISFAQSFYPNMRFGLGVALMNNGYSTYDFGDIAPPVDWWYDEYDFNLGYPLGPAAQLDGQAAQNLLANSGFETGLTGWQLNVFADGQAQATAALDSIVTADGNSSARITIESAGTMQWHVDLEQDSIPLTAGANYQVQFWARADSPRTITVFSQGGAPNFPNYGLDAQISIGTNWSLYTASFVATNTANDGRLEFWVGDVAGNVWLDDVQLSVAPAAVYRRDYSKGVVLLNGVASQQTISLEPGLERFTGTQAPLYQYIVDDSDSGFSSHGPWSVVKYDSGVRHDNGPATSSAELNPPYFHAWELTCHQLGVSAGTAQWSLDIPADGQYTIQVWLPAAPNAGSWTKSAKYHIVSGGNVIASATLDQTTASSGDAWHMIGTVNLTTAGAPILTISNGGSGLMIADAVYVTSSALYNDGSPAPKVTLGGFDGILLQRQRPVAAPTSQVNSTVNAASFQPAIASAGFVSIIGTGFGTATRGWTSSDLSGSNLPTSLDGLSVTINGKPAYVEYISPTQINAIAPDDDTIGQVTVQVTTPQGTSYTATVLKQKLSPGFFTYRSGITSFVAAVHLDGSLVGPTGPSSRPAVPGEVIEIYGTGFGPTNPATPTSHLVSQAAPLASPATVSVGGVNATVQWAGLVSSGLYQLNVTVPAVATGNQPVQTTVSGFQSPLGVFLPVSSK
jgi:uncharacterized protein (TIGR03437 family)